MLSSHFKLFQFSYTVRWLIHCAFLVWLLGQGNLHWTEALVCPDQVIRQEIHNGLTATLCTKTETEVSNWNWNWNWNWDFKVTHWRGNLWLETGVLPSWKGPGTRGWRRNLGLETGVPFPSGQTDSRLWKHYIVVLLHTSCKEETWGPFTQIGSKAFATDSAISL